MGVRFGLFTPALISCFFLWSCTKASSPGSAPEATVPVQSERREVPPAIKIWRTLSRLNPGKGEPSAEIKELLGKEISVVGFVIPNDAAAVDEMHEFLLTPMAGGCIHVPPPPPNYVVHVTLKPGKKAKIPFGAVEVTGRLSLTKQGKERQMYSFEMIGQSVENYDASSYMR